MKKTLAIVLSVMMIICMMPFTGMAYDRAKVAANDAEYIDSLTAEDIASVILDWVDREIAKYTEEMKAAVAEGVLSGFDAFEASFLGEAVYAQIPEIDSLDDVITYKDYLKELGGDFANLDATNLVTREKAGSALGFIDGVLQFMADNSDVFGKVFRWDEEVFDYGKVGEYIESLDTTDPENKKIVDFYNDYLIGNDIQSKFVNWIATQMNYTPAEGETFDDILNNGIMAWFSGLCETNGILSQEGLAALRAYDLRTTDIYTLVKNFVGLVQDDNKAKIDTYYNYIMDTVVRTLLKTALGQTARTEVTMAGVPASFTETYKDLALLEEISGGTVYYKDGDTYYKVTIADGKATNADVITWADALDINFEAPTATIYTGANCDEKVQVYRPTSEDVPVLMYATAKNQALIGDVGIEFAGTEVAAEYAALMTEANAKALSESFGITVAQGEEIISELELSFAEIEAFAEEKALEAAQNAVATSGINASLVAVEKVDITISYEGYATEDEFICNVVVSDPKVTLSGMAAGMAQSIVDTAVASAIGAYIDNPVVTVVVDNLSGNINIDDAKALLDFIDTDFAIDADLLDIAGNYDEYDGAVGQVNHILYGLVDMLVSDAGMEKLALIDGDNTNFTANLEKICATANDMMVAAEEVMNDEGLQEMLAGVGIDLSAILGELDLDLLYAIDFSSVEALWVSVISMGLDLVDDGTNATVAEIHAALEGLTNLDAMAVAMTDYVLGKCIPDANANFADLGLALTVPAKTDAAAVAEGAGKDIIMTKLVDVLYEAAVWGVDFLNDTVNDILADLGEEAGMELPEVAFKLDVTKGATWDATLTALVDRAYELLDGIVIACDNDYTDTFDKIAAVANAILPLGSLASNCKSDDGKLALDVKKVVGYIFDDGLDGNLDGFLGLFETEEKTADVAEGVSVTEALIVASEHIVDSIFPDTVKAELYVNLADYTNAGFTEITVQEYFTSAQNDAVIASNNMKSINARKAELVPAALNLVREAGILPFFAKCDKDHTAADLKTVLVPGTAATCDDPGVEDAYKCAECGYVVSGGKTIAAKGHSYTSAVTKAPTCTATGVRTYTCKNDASHTYTETIAATGHSYGAWTVTTAATCAKEGVETRTCACGEAETRAIAATGNHADADGNKICDDCGHDWNEKEEDNGFFAKIKAFFQKIIDWFKNLFK